MDSIKREIHYTQIIIQSLYLYLESMEQKIMFEKDEKNKTQCMIIRTDTKRLIQAYEKKLKERKKTK